MSIFDFYKESDIDLSQCPVSLLRDTSDPSPAPHTLSRDARFPALGDDEPLMGVTHAREISFHPRCHIWERGGPLVRFSFVLNGAGWFITNSVRVRVGPGSFFTRVPYEEHFVIATSQLPLQMYVIMCRGALARELNAELLGPKAIAQRVLNQAEILHLYQQALDEAESNTEQSQRIVGLYTEAIVRKLNIEASTQSPTRTRAYATYRNCRDYINQHAKQLVSTSQVAEACKVDPSYLGRLFKRFEQMKPYEYLLRIKFSHATDLLLNTDHSIQEIAEQLGFTDPFTFSRAFKRMLGQSPSHYREGQRAADN